MAVFTETALAPITVDQIIAVFDDAVAASVAPPIPVVPVAAVVVVSDVAADERIGNTVEKVFNEYAVMGFGGRYACDRKQCCAGAH